MELESLKRQLMYLEKAEISIAKLVTDRHSQVSAYMAQEKPNITHAYDVWHLAKGNVQEIQLSIFLMLQSKLLQLFLQYFYSSLFAGEKKRLQKIVKTKKFRALKPWIGV